MDIEAISGPRVTDTLHLPVISEEPEPVLSVLAPMVNDTIRINWNVRDRVTISREARRRYEEAARGKKREEVVK